MYTIHIDKKATNNYKVSTETMYSVLDKKEGLTFQEVKDLIKRSAPLTPKYIYNGWQELPYYFFKE